MSYWLSIKRVYVTADAMHFLLVKTQLKHSDFHVTEKLLFKKKCHAHSFHVYFSDVEQEHSETKRIKKKLAFLLSWNSAHNSPVPSSLAASLNTFILLTEKELERFEQERERILKKGYSQPTQCTITEL